VRPVAQLTKLAAGLGLEDGIKRFIERLPGLSCAVPSLARQDVDRHRGHSLVFVHDLPLFPS
jgi:hypothetical protein